MKIVKKENYRVVVYPATGWSNRPLNEKEAESSCRSIMADIKRHVDDIGEISVDCDVSIVCSFCGYNWEIEPETGEPQCCTKAQNEWINEGKKTTP